MNLSCFFAAEAHLEGRTLRRAEAYAPHVGGIAAKRRRLEAARRRATKAGAARAAAAALAALAVGGRLAVGAEGE